MEIFHQLSERVQLPRRFVEKSTDTFRTGFFCGRKSLGNPHKYYLSAQPFFLPCREHTHFLSCSKPPLPFFLFHRCIIFLASTPLSFLQDLLPLTLHYISSSLLVFRYIHHSFLYVEAFSNIFGWLLVNVTL